jgi:hypothetical protein
MRQQSKVGCSKLSLKASLLGRWMLSLMYRIASVRIVSGRQTAAISYCSHNANRMLIRRPLRNHQASKLGVEDKGGGACWENKSGAARGVSRRSAQLAGLQAPPIERCVAELRCQSHTDPYRAILWRLEGRSFVPSRCRWLLQKYGPWPVRRAMNDVVFRQSRNLTQP